MVNKVGLITMRAQIQILVKTKTLGDFFVIVLALMDNVISYLLLVGGPVELVEVRTS